VLTDGVLEVTHPASALRPLSRLRFDAAATRFVPEDGIVDPRDAPALAAALAALAGRTSPEARAERWRLGTFLAAAEASAALRRLPDWRDAAAAVRRTVLRAVDAGQPHAAAALAAFCREVPHALRFLGNALPTEEAVALLRPLGRVCELGAGPGLFARALERAGMAVAASDPATGSGTGVAFPVRRGFDAAATIATFRAMGEVPPLLMLWPQLDEGDWFAGVFAGLPPGAWSPWPRRSSSSACRRPRPRDAGRARRGGGPAGAPPGRSSPAAQRIRHAGGGAGRALRMAARARRSALAATLTDLADTSTGDVDFCSVSCPTRDRG
jgi:hypothetical protein